KYKHKKGAWIVCVWKNEYLIRVNNSGGIAAGIIRVKNCGWIPYSHIVISVKLLISREETDYECKQSIAYPFRNVIN
ncbi:MAG: hypothetical protein M3R00_10740, partial [Pseudomonadota bacterium]|nr:hypothetical protein [Pseudomonadota bacterium]